MSEETIQTTTEVEKPAPKKRGRPRKTAVAVVENAAIEKKAPVKRVRKIAVKVEPEVKDKPAAGDQYVFAVGRRKKAVARVFMYKRGNGEIEINNRPLEQYFGRKILQEIVGQAIQHSPFKKSARVVVQVRGGGLTGQAEAARLGIAHALLKLDETLRLTLRSRGYLTRDSRRKERKKPGLKKARRAPQWQKR